MQTLDLHAFNLNALSNKEMAVIDGGNIFEKIWNWVVDTVDNIVKFIKDNEVIEFTLGFLALPALLIFTQ